jgi:hypothetical protein
MMHFGGRAGRDPFWDDGVGAKKTRIRKRAVTIAALGAAIAACGLTAAVWIRELAPAAERLLG